MRALTLLFGLLISAFAASAADMSRGADNFYQSDKVTREKVSFKNQYQMGVTGTLFRPKTASQTARLPAIVVGHPMGAVKEQSASLYAQKMAEQGFVTLASTSHSGAKVKGSRVTRLRRISMPKTSAPPWTTWVPAILLTATGLGCWGSAAVAVSSSAPRSLIHA